MGLCASNPKSVDGATEPVVAGSGASGAGQSSAEQQVAGMMESKRLAIQRKRRMVVSAESYDVEGAGTGASVSMDQYEKKKIPKSDASRKVIETALRNHFLFTTLEDREIREVIDAMAPIETRTGDEIIKQGSEGDMFYVVEDGSFDVEVNGKRVAGITTGGSFGELALMYNCPRAATIKATSNAKLWGLERVAFRHILVASNSKTVANNMRFLRNIELLQKLTEGERSRLAEALQRVTFTDGQYIIKQGDEGHVFYILSEGQCRVTKTDKGAETEIMTLKSGDHFGERALLRAEPRAANVIAVGDVECMALDRESFTELLGPLEQIMQEEHSKRLVLEKEASVKAKPEVEVRTPLRSDMQLKDFRTVAILGEGAFGMVRLVQHKTKKEVFALKTMQKARIVATKQQRNVLNEKRIMMECDHPYILKLFATYRDRNCVYILLEFLQGGDMFGHLINNDGVFSVPTAKTYAGIVATVFEYLHSRSIVYRDLKPENLVLDAHGYLKVVDFGFAKKVSGRTYTLCGTPEYLAPETVQGKGHNKGVDYWALGILIFEMLCGYSPFADQQNNDQLTIYKNILRGNLQFPSTLRDAKAKDLIKRLLHPNSSQRYGCLKAGTNDIKRHSWFADLDWKALMAQKVEPPIKPRVRGKMDTSNFEDWGPDTSRVEPYVPDGTNWDAEF